MRRVLILCALLLLCAQPARSQGMVGIAAVDSAMVARGAWNAAVRAIRQKDLAGARAAMERASSAWPTQPTYLWYRAALAAEVGDTAATIAALRDYAQLGLGRELKDTAFDKFRATAGFRDVVEAHDRNRAPLARSRVLRALRDSSMWPEGVAVDARTGNVYVTSIRHRTIVEVRPDGRERELWPRRSVSIGGVYSVRVDPRNAGVLFATTSALPQMDGYSAADSAVAALLRVRASDGAILTRWDIPGGRRHTLGDLAIGPGGDVFVTDSDEPVLYWLRAGGDTLETLRSPLFRSLQGVAPAPDGRTLYVADYSHGLLRVDLATQAVTRLTEARGITTLGCDGIAWYKGSLIAIQNGVSPARVMRFQLDAWGTHVTSATVLDRNFEVADEPTIGTVVGDEFIYVANSQWEKHDAAGAVVKGAKVRAPVLLTLRLQ